MAELIDVVIVAYDCADDIRRLVPLLGTHAAIGRVVVVDHGTDGSGRVAEELGAHALANPDNPGFGAGQNAGRRLTTAPFVLVLNPDATIDVDAIARATSHLTRDIAAVQGLVVNVSTGEPERSAGRALSGVHLWGRLLRLRRLGSATLATAIARRWSLLRDHVERVPAEPTAVEVLASTATLFRRDALDDVGGYDESFFMYGEDLDLCWRLRARHWRLIALPDVWCRHVSGGTSRSTWERELRWWQGTLRYGAMRWPRPTWLAAVPAAALRAAGLAIRRPSRGRHAFSALVLQPIAVRRMRTARN